jgi:hypothetical protein
MNSMRNRLVIVALAIAVVLGLLACSTGGGLIARNEPTATPTKTPKPTFTITPTPTDTPIPTDTPTPTATFTPTPEATNTPIILTATPTEVPTETPEPTATAVPPTATRRPAPAPTRVPPTATRPPQPTNTPAPQFPWNGVVSNQFQNCGLTRVFGFTLDNKGGLAGDIWVHYWADGWNGDWAKSQWTDFGAATAYKGDEGNWDGTIDVSPRDGVWHVCVTAEDESWTCISNTVSVRTSVDCTTAHQVFHITFRKN